MMKRNSWRTRTGSFRGEHTPWLNFSVFKPLEQIRQLVYFPMVKEGVIKDTLFGSLAFHHVNGVMKNAFDEKITRLGHERARARKMPQCHREGSTVILVTMGNSHRLNVYIRDLRVKRKTLPSLNARRSSCVQKYIVATGFDQPGTGANCIGRIEIGDTHGVKARGSRCEGRAFCLETQPFTG